MYNKRCHLICKCTGTDIPEDIVKYVLLRKNFGFERRKDLSTVVQTFCKAFGILK